MLNVYRVSQKNLAFILLAIFAAGLFGGYYFSQGTVPVGNEVKMTIAAVDAQGKGVTGELITIARPASMPGAGQVLVSVNNVLSQYDTQISARTAVKAAGAYTKKKMEDYDIIYVIKANAQAIEGPSAGAAMAISAVAAAENKTLQQHIVITGGITEGGEVTPVGGIPEKAKAAKEAGASAFLVPKGQSGQSEIERAEQCYLRNGQRYCIINYVPAKNSTVNGLDIVEVSNIGDALSYFIK